MILCFHSLNHCTICHLLIVINNKHFFLMWNCIEHLSLVTRADSVTHNYTGTIADYIGVWTPWTLVSKPHIGHERTLISGSHVGPMNLGIRATCWPHEPLVYGPHVGPMNLGIRVDIGPTTSISGPHIGPMDLGIWAPHWLHKPWYQGPMLILWTLVSGPHVTPMNLGIWTPCWPHELWYMEPTLAP